jgi:hypothetical protein
MNAFMARNGHQNLKGKEETGLLIFWNLDFRFWI